MSRSISISYRDKVTGADTPIEIPLPHDLLGTQGPSMAFWSLPRIKEIGIERLAQLGVTDPVYFFGWDEMALLDREITLLGQYLSSIEFPDRTKTEWFNNLSYCYRLLIETAPKAAIPIFGIG